MNRVFKLREYQVFLTHPHLSNHNCLSPCGPSATFSAAQSWDPPNHVLPIKIWDTGPPHMSPLTFQTSYTIIQTLLSCPPYPIIPMPPCGARQEPFMDEGTEAAGPHPAGPSPPATPSQFLSRLGCSLLMAKCFQSRGYRFWLILAGAVQTQGRKEGMTLPCR